MILGNDNFEKIFDFLDANDIIAFDVETTGLNTRKDKVIGIGLSNATDSFYIPTLIWNGQTHDQTISFDQLSRLFDILKTKKLLTHNGSFDLRMIKSNYKAYLVDALYADTMLLKHTVDEDRPFGLKEIAKQVFGLDAAKEQQEMKDSIKAHGGAPSEFYKADLLVLAKYCEQDCKLTYRLFEHYSRQLKAQNLEKLFYVDEVMPLYKHVTIPMEMHGINLDMPLLKQTVKEIQADIKKLEAEILREMAPHLDMFETWFLNKDFPVKRTGEFPQAYARHLNLQLPLTPAGKFSLTAKNLEKLGDCEFTRFMNGTLRLDNSLIKTIQLQMNSGAQMFNLSSKHHLKKLFFDTLKEEPVSKTKLGSPQVDDTFLKQMAKKYKFAAMLQDYNKLIKLDGTYFSKFLEVQENGVFYPSFKQHNTTSGRYGSDIQQLPRQLEKSSKASDVVRKYTNLVRDLIISPPGKVLVGADYSSLEVVVFADDAGDESLINMIKNNEDFYSRVAIDVLGLQEYSAIKDADDFLKNHKPEVRQNSKCFAEGTSITIKRDGVEQVRYIENAKVGDEVLTKHGWKKITALTTRSVDKYINFATTRGGFVCTADHKIWDKARQTWKKAEKFVEDDIVEFSIAKTTSTEYQYVPVFTNASLYEKSPKASFIMKIDEDWAWIIGAFLGDGISNYSRRSGTSGLLSAYVGICGLAEDQVVGSRKSIMEDFRFSCRPNVKSGEASGGKDLTTITCRDMEAVKLFQHSFGLIKQREMANEEVRTLGRKNLMVPEFIFNSPDSVKLSFVAGLIDTNGWTTPQQTFNISTKDFSFATQIIALINSLGVESILSLDYNKTYKRYYYRVTGIGKHCQVLINMGLTKYMKCSRKVDRLYEREISTNKVRFETRVRKNSIVEKSIQVFDIEVEDVHEFIANGIRVHNCYSLGLRYGMREFKLAKTLNIPKKEASRLINNYFKAYPKLKTRMDELTNSALKNGYVISKAGRIRHMPLLKKLHYAHGPVLGNSLDLWAKFHENPKLYEQMKYLSKQYTKAINNALNFPIQSMAASIVNRASIAINKRFKAEGINAQIIINIHDELVCLSSEEDASKVVTIMRDLMENTTKLDAPLVAIPEVGTRYSEIK